MGHQASHDSSDDSESPDLNAGVHSTPSLETEIEYTPTPQTLNGNTSNTRCSVTLTARLSSRFKHIPIETPSVIPKMMPQTSFPDVPTLASRKPQLRQNNQSSFANVSNGITGTHISSRISKIAAKFWYKHVENLDMKQRLEIGCSIFFGAFSSNKKMRGIMKEQFSAKYTCMELKCLKFLDMIGWLLRNLLKDNIDLESLLINLGEVHQNMGVTIQHFDSMLQSMHEAFSYYFPQEYNVQVKYAMDEIFTITAQIMSGQDLSFSSYLNMVTKSFQYVHDIDFLKNLDICLQSVTGKEYFYQYLKQTFCDEIVLFLQTISEFRGSSTCIQRFMVARDIVRASIDPDADFAINISFDCRTDIMNAMQKTENEYKTKAELTIDDELFSEAEKEIHRLMMNNHWVIFKNNMKVLQNKSFGL